MKRSTKSQMETYADKVPSFAKRIRKFDEKRQNLAREMKALEDMVQTALDMIPLRPLRKKYQSYTRQMDFILRQAVSFKREEKHSNGEDFEVEHVVDLLAELHGYDEKYNESSRIAADFSGGVLQRTDHEIAKYYFTIANLKGDWVLPITTTSMMKWLNSRKNTRLTDAEYSTLLSSYSDKCF
jgi:hypothetical protein